MCLTPSPKVVLPHLFIALDNANELTAIRKSACVAMDVFAQNLGKDILPYLDPLVKKLTLLAQDKEQAIQVCAISALKSVAMAAESAFIPYADVLLQLMKHLMQIQGPKSYQCCSGRREAVRVIHTHTHTHF